MAIFNINIQDSGSFDTGQLDLNVFYGTVENFPTNETEVNNLNNILIEKEFIELSFTNSFNKYCIALPSTINLNKVLSVNNFYEDITSIFKENNFALQIEQDSVNVNYTIYRLESNRKFLENFKLVINIAQ